MDEDPIKIITAGLARFFDAAVARGFKFPFYLVAVSADGVMIFVRYMPANGENADDGLIAEKLADHEETGTLFTPFNLMLTDSTGQYSLMLVRHSEAEAGAEFLWPCELPSD